MYLTDGALAHLREVADEPELTGTRYRMIAAIGRGGMGTVYRVHDEQLDRDVALKVLRTPELHAHIARRLSAEARILARLEHPGIVPIYDAGVLPDGRVYYAMKLVRGRRLDHVVSAALPLTERLRIFLRICEPVAFAHAHGIVHRDLKPENVMLGEFGEVFVMDWGVARRSDIMESGDRPHDGDALPAETSHGTRLGTPGWMAPEQERGLVDSMGPPTDVFALGVLLRVLLDPNAPTPSGMHRNTPRPLRAVHQHACAPEPAQRYRDARALAADVERFLNGVPVLAYREPVWERAARFLRKHRTAVLLIITYLLMRVLLIAFG